MTPNFWVWFWRENSRRTIGNANCSESVLTRSHRFVLVFWLVKAALPETPASAVRQLLTTFICKGPVLKSQTKFLSIARRFVHDSAEID